MLVDTKEHCIQGDDGDMVSTSSSREDNGRELKEM